MWAWVLHRVTGLGVVLFVGLHILDTALLGWGPDVYNAVVQIYHLPVVRVLEVVLAGAVLYHALNGIRIIAIDFWDDGFKHQRPMFYAAGVVFIVSFLSLAFVMLRPLFS
jgi:succinate dehydrogenase / fumarate reductase, cytochrome b subunit